MEPKPQLNETLKRIADKREADERALLAEVEVIEDQFGISYDQLIELYGEGVLDVANPRSAQIDKLLSLCELLRNTDKAMVAIVELRPNPPEHGCKPQLAGLRSSFQASIVVLADPHESQVRIHSSGAASTNLLLEGNGYRLIQRPGLRAVEPTFDDLTTEPTPLVQILASGVRRPNLVDTELSDYYSLTVAGDNFRELYNDIASHLYTIDVPADELLLDASLRRLSYGDRR